MLVSRGCGNAACVTSARVISGESQSRIRLWDYVLEAHEETDVSNRTNRVGSRALTPWQTRVRPLRPEWKDFVLVRVIGYFSPQRTKQDLFI